MEKARKWIKAYWWAVVLVVVTVLTFYLWRTEQAVLPSPIVEEVADRAISTADDIDTKLKAIQTEVLKTRQEVSRRDKKITAEVQDLDCVALASRWNRIVADERQRRISGDATSQDR